MCPALKVEVKVEGKEEVKVEGMVTETRTETEMEMETAFAMFPSLDCPSKFLPQTLSLSL